MSARLGTLSQDAVAEEQARQHEQAAEDHLTFARIYRLPARPRAMLLTTIEAFSEDSEKEVGCE